MIGRVLLVSFQREKRRRHETPTLCCRSSPSLLRSVVFGVRCPRASALQKIVDGVSCLGEGFSPEAERQGWMELKSTHKATDNVRLDEEVGKTRGQRPLLRTPFRL